MENIVTIVLSVLGVIILFSGLFIVQQQEVAVIERLGKFVRTAGPGLNFKIPLIESVRGRVSLQVRELDIPGKFKTRDNNFISVFVRVQFIVIPTSVYEAFYLLANPAEQISAFVSNTVRAKVADMNLADVFAHQDSIGEAVNMQLSTRMAQFGFQITNSLVTEIMPAAEVVAAMNKVLETENLKKAAENEGEAHRIQMVKKAEAEAESKKLQGEGIANQRIEIAKGIKIAAELMREGMSGADDHAVMQLLILNQHYDMLNNIGQSNAKIMLVPFSPQSVEDLQKSIAGMFMGAEAAGGVPGPKPPKI
ncbi:MAG: SPFH domain-containing protein [Armatimonadetes bacterium]|nr:SPFH domain-containing protein [Armatimonadota bacterium]